MGGGGPAVERAPTLLPSVVASELEQVAAELRLSPRVFYRRLADQGMNFRQLRDSSLQQMAESYLLDGRLSLADVSLLLGYTEQSAFARAFKRWTGTSPLQWRRARCAGEQTAIAAVRMNPNCAALLAP